ncbi:MAG: universal stress protein [Chloroflexota bacterium]
MKDEAKNPSSFILHPSSFQTANPRPKNGARMNGAGRRVQVLFRPEDVALAATADGLDCPRLGRGEVEQSTFAGSFERLRLRLPPIAGVRAIAPAVPFGSDSILVEATRPREQAERLPLRPGQQAWVGVRNIHALAHPGLNFLIATDGSLRAQAALSLGGHIARLAHARVTLLGYGQPGEAKAHHLQAAKEQLGSGLASLETHAADGPLSEAITHEVERQPYDLVVVGIGRQDGLSLAEEMLGPGEHHLLLVSGPQPAPARALICVASGEPGKEDVLFAGRLIRHLGAEATLLSVLPELYKDNGLAQTRTERFLAGGVRTLELLGVTAQPITRTGLVEQEIVSQVQAAPYDLVVLGAPLADRDGHIALAGVVSHVWRHVSQPVLIVRSHSDARQDTPWPLLTGRRLIRETA